jgi:PAS domain-containing protein
MKQWELAGVTVGQGSAEDVAVRPRDSVRVLVDQLPGIVWTTDPGLRLTSLFGQGLRSLRLGPNQIVGVTLLELVGTSDWPMVVAHRQALRGEVGGFDLEWGQRRFRARVGPLRDASGDLIGAVCVAIETEPQGAPPADAVRLPLEDLVLP